MSIPMDIDKYDYAKMAKETPNYKDHKLKDILLQTLKSNKNDISKNSSKREKQITLQDKNISITKAIQTLETPETDNDKKIAKELVEIFRTYQETDHLFERNRLQERNTENFLLLLGAYGMYEYESGGTKKIEIGDNETVSISIVREILNKTERNSEERMLIEKINQYLNINLK